MSVLMRDTVGTTTRSPDPLRVPVSAPISPLPSPEMHPGLILPENGAPEPPDAAEYGDLTVWFVSQNHNLPSLSAAETRRET